MTQGDGAVYIVDDDSRLTDALCGFLETYGLHAIAFGTIADYLAFDRLDLPACLVLDVRLPDISGLEFQLHAGREDHPPIVFLTGYGDIRSSVFAMKRGAVDYLTKPFREDELMRSVEAAIDIDRISRIERADLLVLQKRLASLTPREREVLPLVSSGLLNKQAAAELGVSEVTLQVHRSRIMRKMEASSLAELVRIAEKLRINSNMSRHPGSAAK